MKINKFIFIFLLISSLNLPAWANPQQYNTYLMSGYKAYKNGDFSGAIRNYKKAAEISPGNFEIQYNLGVIYSKINDLNNAELSYKKAVKLKSSCSAAYLNLSNLYLEEKNYAQAAVYLEKYTKLVPSDDSAFYNLAAAYGNSGNNYAQSNQYKKAIYCYEKSLNIKKDDKIYSNLATIYIKTENYKLAGDNFRKALDLNPGNSTAQEGLSSALRLYKEDIANKNIINLMPAQKAPQEVYNLVRTTSVLKYGDTFDKLYEILDFLWGDENGRILLTQIIKHKIPIQITFGKADTDAKTTTSYKRTPLSIVRYIPMPVVIAIPTALAFDLLKPDIKKEVKITVNLGEDIIQLYKNPSSSFNENMYAIMAVEHEFGHAASSTVKSKKNNSLEEEMTVSMIGYNSASKILTGRLLTKEESFEYSKMCFKSLMSDDHKNLPLYNDFKNTISELGINLYNYDTYADLYRLRQETPQ